MGFLASIFGTPKSQAQQVRSVGEDGYVDFDLPLESHTKNPSGSATVAARGVLSNVPVGFSLEIPPTWKESRLEGENITLYWGRATLRSIGPSSDNFVVALTRMYGGQAQGVMMRKAIEVEVVGLGADPRQLSSGLVHMKLFFNSNGPSDAYAEVFLNIDLPGRVVQFREKDLEYRQPLLRTLSEAA